MENNRDIIKSEFKYYLANVARSARRTSEGFNLGKTAVDSFMSFIEANRLFDYNPEKWSHIESMYDITNPEKVKQVADDLLNDNAFIKHDNEKNQGWRSGAISHYVCFINARSFFKHEKNETNSSNNEINKSLQQIFYGAPGTGKSHKIKDDVDVKAADEKNLVFRTTFHPDSDYSTFVGCYKPTKAESKRLQRMNLSLEDLAKELGSYYTNEEFGKIGGIQKFCFEYYPYIDGEYMSVNITKLLELAGVPKDYNVEINKYIKFCHLLPKQDPDKITYNFIPQAFTNAYVKAWNTDENVYLIIEEINRGNCAQIFGDLFQLLDRKNGVSEYPVEADTDLQNYLCKALIDTKRTDIPDDVKSGKKLMLPTNLYIWATMNTSDQSLFPIDSAFKRRLEWKYIKIKEGKDENGNKLDWKVGVKMDEEGTLLPWWDFIKKINEIIASMTSSADKQLGYFFCCAKDGVIDEETFVSKVIFYLWNDVFKDYGFEDASLFRYTTKNEDGKDMEKDLTFPDFYDEEGEKVDTERLTDFVKKVMSWKKTNAEQD
jgi:hypothetical protein